MKTEQVKLTKLKVNSENPRTITKDKFEKLINSILVFPRMLEIRPIVVDGDYTALGGNQRTEALKAIAKMEITTIADRLTEVADFQRISKAEQEDLIRYWDAWILGDKKVPVIKADELTEDERKQFIIKDNSSFGSYDWDMLANSWDADLLTDWGLDLPTDWDTTEEETREASEDDFTEEDAANVETRVKAGEIWQLGEHRLMCGDSTKKEDVERLMGGEKADMVFTDPPYKLETKGGCKDDVGKSLKKQGDEIEFISDFNPKYFLNILPSVFDKKNINSYIFCNKELLVDYLNWAVENKYSYNVLIWKKPNAIPIRDSHRPDIEYLLLFRKNTIWNNAVDGVNYSRCLEYGRVKKSEENGEHPTIKPIELIANEMKISSNEGSVVMDFFGGSGSTLIACEQLNRKCRIMELSEHYCDVIIARWEKMTGGKAEKILE